MKIGFLRSFVVTCFFVAVLTVILCPASVPAFSLNKALPGKKVEVKALSPPLTSGMVDQLGGVMFKMKLKMHGNTRDCEGVEKRVFERLVKVSKKSKKYSKAAKSFQWECKTLVDDELNAFGLPGGKVGIYSGMLNYIKDDEDGLAIVIAHEFIHSLARHAADRIDGDLRDLLVAAAAKNKLSQEGLDSKTTTALMTAMGVAYKGSAVKAFNNKIESESDHEGLLLMSEAGYNPEIVPLFWEGMMDKKKHGGKLPGILLSHPSDAQRIEAFRKWLPEAEKKYKLASK